jgi:ABC-2 type transport system ATP-binding protein
VIEVSGVTKQFGRFVAVRDLAFTVSQGEVLGFLGPNGAGKTTTMRILTGFIPPTIGTARVAGHDVVRDPLAAKRKTGYLPENPPLYPEMTVIDYLDFVARIKGVPPGRRKSRVAETLERCALSEVRQTLTGKLSRGYRQRVGLAQALVHDPEVLILDEPTAGLDPKQINQTRDLIRSLGGTHTIVLSTHILPEVSMTCDRVVIIHRGRVVASGTTESLTEKLGGGAALEVTVAGSEARASGVLLEVPALSKVEAVRRGNGWVSFRLEVREGEDARSDVSRRIVGAGLGLLGLRQEGMSLEDVYLRIISSEEHGERGEEEGAAARDIADSDGARRAPSSPSASEGSEPSASPQPERRPSEASPEARSAGGGAPARLDEEGGEY